MAKMKNNDLIESFASGAITDKDTSHTGNLWVTDNTRKLMNYGTVLAHLIDGTWYLNRTKYSVTTSKIQGRIAYEFSGRDYIEVRDVPMGQSSLVSYVKEVSK